MNIRHLNDLNPIYTLSGGIDSSLIFSYLDNPTCFCVQVDGNDDYDYAKKLYPNVIKIEFNDVDIEKILTEVQSIWKDGFHCMMSDMYDYFVYKQFEDRLIIVGEEPRYDLNGNDMTMKWRKLFFHFRYKKVDSPYMYNTNIYDKKIIMLLAKKRLPAFINKRKKRNYSGPNPVWIEKHKDQIEYLKKKHNIEEEEDFNKMWRQLNFTIWKAIHD